MSTLVRMPLDIAQSSAVVVGHFDADPRDDVAIAGSGGVRVLLADADGGFDVAAARFVRAPPVITLLAGEFTGDGRTDLVASGYDGRVFVLTGDGLGNFTPGPELGPAQGTALQAVADLNSDARSDLVVTTFDPGGASLRLLLGDGAGGLAESGAFPVAANPFPVAVVGDLDADPRPDVLVSGPAGADVLQILSGDGSAGLRPALDRATAISNVAAMALADFNGDQRVDVAAVMAFGTVRVLFGDGRGHFAAPKREIFLSGGFGALGLSAADFNGDARPDLLLSGDNNGDTFVYLGDGAGSFRPAAGTPEYGGIYPPAPVTVGDFDGDRRPDLLGLRGGGAPALRVLHNTGGRTPPRVHAQTITIITPRPAQVVRGERVVLSARLRCHPGQVALFRRPLHRPRGHWRRLATARTNARGVAEFSDQPRVSSEYQWRPTGRGKGRIKPTRRVTVQVTRRAGTAR